MTPVPTFRPLAESESELLRTATWTNVNWKGEQRVTYHDIDTAPDLSHYGDLRPARGDFGTVARGDRRVLGVVWVLFFDSADPGYGYVGDGAPS